VAISAEGVFPFVHTQVEGVGETPQFLFCFLRFLVGDFTERLVGVGSN